MTLFGEIVEKVCACLGFGMFLWFICLFIRSIENDKPSLYILVFLWALRKFIFIMWLAITVSNIGNLWFKVSGPENVPQWAVTLFQTYKE